MTVSAQRSLFDPAPRARKNNPGTSKAAADSMREGAAVQRQRVIAALALGTATADAIDEFVGWRPTTAGRRLKELETMGLVARVPGTTRPTRSGREAQVWSIRPAGRERLGAA